MADLLCMGMSVCGPHPHTVAWPGDWCVSVMTHCAPSQQTHALAPERQQIPGHTTTNSSPSLHGM